MILVAKQLNVPNKEKNLVLLKYEVKCTLGKSYYLGLQRIFTVSLYTLEHKIKDLVSTS